MEAVRLEQDKTVLRRRFREARLEFSRREGSRVRSALEHNISRLVRDLHAPQVALFKPMPEEAAFDLSAEFFYPRIDGDKIQFLKSAKKFAQGPFGILQPEIAGATPIDLKKPMLIFCPAVAVDLRGTRLGMGKGYYDCFFADHSRAVRAAVIYQI